MCADSATGTIRLIHDQNHEITRNLIGRLGDTRVTVDYSIVWGGKKAITAHIEKLQTFDPTEETVALRRNDAPGDANAKEAPRADSEARDGRRVASGVMAGKRVSGGYPVYPGMALQRRIRGTVVLSALITREGKVANLFALASPDPLLTQAAIDTVSKWTYTPYLLLGKPIGISTTITLNFNLNPL